MQGFALIDERRDMHIPCTGHQRKTTQTGGCFLLFRLVKRTPRIALMSSFGSRKATCNLQRSKLDSVSSLLPHKKLTNPLAGL
jgi:hypothetical protein